MPNEIAGILTNLIAAGGGAATIAYLLFKKFGEKWLDAKFEEKLAAYRHAQQKEIEHLRYQITGLLDRASKLNQREFEVLPEAWSKLNEAYSHTMGVISSAQMYPDLAKMTQDQLEDFVQRLDFHDWEKVELRLVEDKNKYFRERFFWHRLSRTKAAVHKSHLFLAKNSIFLERELKEAFDRIRDLIWGALDEYELLGMYPKMPLDEVKKRALIQDGPAALLALEKQIHLRLWSSKDASSIQ